MKLIFQDLCIPCPQIPRSVRLFPNKSYSFKIIDRFGAGSRFFVNDNNEESNRKNKNEPINITKRPSITKWLQNNNY